MSCIRFLKFLLSWCLLLLLSIGWLTVTDEQTPIYLTPRPGGRSGFAPADDDNNGGTAGINKCAGGAMFYCAAECPLLAQSGHFATESQCPLLGVKRTLVGDAAMSAYDPKRTLGAGRLCVTNDAILDPKM